ncbi:MAG TPA: 50S ribosomal protein L9, partial [Vicinamibacterales bacterium]|nr:50S ribosomal protein L9 [Vicinamibacterales bacterium]
RNLALPATDANKKRVERERKIVETRESEDRQAAEAIATRLTALDLSIARRVGENDQLYGSVTNADIAELLAQKGFELDRRKILLPDPIKTLGETTIPVKLHRDVTARLRVSVVKET